MYLTGHEDGKAFDLLENPILHSYGNIEQSFLDSRALLKVVQYNPGSWSLLLRNMQLPSSDAVLFERNNAAITRGATAVGVKLVSRLNLLSQTPDSYFTRKLISIYSE